MAEVTRLLNEWRQGNQAAFDEASSILYSELHRIAERYMYGSAGTLQPTALVNEAYIRLTGGEQPYRDRKHFYALAAKVMRQVLVDGVRSRHAAKRGGAQTPETLDEARHGAENRIESFLILDEALTNLAQSQPRLAQIVELHYFGGLSGSEIADVLSTSPSTISREQRLAEAWLKRALSGANSA